MWLRCLLCCSYCATEKVLDALRCKNFFLQFVAMPSQSMYSINTGEFYCFSARLYSEGDESVPFLWLALSTASPVGVAVFFCHVEPNYINTVIRGAFGGSTVLSNKQWPTWNYLPWLIHVREPLSSPFSSSLGALKFFLLCSLGFKVNEETQAINLECWFESGETADREWRKWESWKRCSFLCTGIILEFHILCCEMNVLQFWGDQRRKPSLTWSVFGAARQTTEPRAAGAARSQTHRRTTCPRGNWNIMWQQPEYSEIQM